MPENKGFGLESTFRTVILLLMVRPVPCSASTGVVLANDPPHHGFYAVPTLFAKLQFELKVLDDVAAFDLFKRLAPDVARAHEAESWELVKDLEGLPLAIQVAGRLLHAKSRGSGWDIRELIRELRSRTEMLLRQGVPPNMKELVDDLRRSEGVPSITIAALLELSTKQLSSDAVRDRFADLGAQAPKPAMFDIDDVLGLWKMSAFDEAAPILDELIDIGLIQRIEGSAEGKSRARKPPKVWFTMHALLVALARSLAAR